MTYVRLIIFLASCVIIVRFAVSSVQAVRRKWLKRRAERDNYLR